MSDVLYTLAASMHLWRNGAICALALFVIGCLQLYASLIGEN